MDAREWRRARREGERQPGNGERHRGPINPQVQRVNEQRAFDQYMRQMNVNPGMDENGYLGGGPRNRGTNNPSHEQDQVMERQIRMERQYNNNRRTGGYGQDRLGEMAHPGERPNMDPRESARLRDRRRQDEQLNGFHNRPLEHNQMYDVAVDPRYHRGGVGRAGPRLSGGGPAGMDPMQREHFRPGDPYLRRNDGGMDPAVYDSRMDGPRWIRK